MGINPFLCYCFFLLTKNILLKLRSKTAIEISFHMYLQAGTKIRCIEFNEVWTTEKPHTTYNAMYPYILPLTT